MNWKEWLGYSIYKKLWSLIGKRPWTFIRRDWWHEYEIINIVFFVSVGFLSGLFYCQILQWLFSAWYHLIILVASVYFIGAIQGHFYWGKTWIKGQQDN